MKLKICTVTTIKASIEQTLTFVNYHLAIGVDRIFLFFDDPLDPAVTALLGYKQVRIFRCDTGHWKKLCNEENPTFFDKQKANATYALDIARREKFDWIAHIDSDEFIYCHSSSLSGILQKTKKETNLVYLRVLEWVPKDLEELNVTLNSPCSFKETVMPASFKNAVNFISGIRLLVYRSYHKVKMRFASLLNIKFKHGFILGHEQGKCIVRITENVCGLDIHFPMMKTPKKFQYFHSIAILHFEARGFLQWRTKWQIRIDGQQNYKFGSSKEVYISKLFEKIKDNELLLKKLYRGLYLLPPRKNKLLHLIGLVKQINLNKSIFQKAKAVNQ